MDRSVSLELKYTVDDALRVARFIQNRSFIYRYDAILTAGVVLIAFTLLIIFMANELTAWVFLGGLIWSTIPAILVGLTVWMVHGPVGRRLARRRVEKFFDSSLLIKQETDVGFSNSQITTRNSLASTELKWDAVVSVLNSPTDFIFFTGNDKFGWFVPKAAFRSSEDVAVLEEHLRQRMGARFIDDPH